MNASKTAFHIRSSVPGSEAELGIGAGERDGAGAAVEEFLQAGAEGADFGRADEGPGFGEEDEDEPVVGLGIG